MSKLGVLLAVLVALLVGVGAASVVVQAAPVEQVASAQPAPEPAEDDPAFDCTRHGNRVCGPSGTVAPGCYRDGVLVIAWTRFDNPRLDPLYGLAESPC